MIAGDLVAVAALAALLSAASLLSHVKEGPAKADEGYLWYGALRTLEGETPLRDFHSYEPGRYYWCALWMLAFGRGVIPLRVAVYAFYFVGLTSGLLALRLGGVDWPGVIVAGILLAAWADPPYKLFEPALAMVAVLAGVILLTDPELGTVLLAGAVAGGSAFFGFNYGLYSGAALLGLTLLVGWKSGEVEPVEGLAAYLAGVGLGALPLLAMLALVPGMGAAFFELRVRDVLARGTSNLPLPVPWPWRPAPHAVLELGPAGRRVIGVLFLLLPLFAWSVAVWAVLSPWAEIEPRAAMVAASAVAGFGLHHAFSRADPVHLAQSISPLILGLVALVGNRAGLGVLAVLLGSGTMTTVLAIHPRVRRRRRPGAYVIQDIHGSPLWVTLPDALLLDAVRSAVERHLDPGDPLLAVPTLATLLPMLDRRSAVYDIFCVFPASAIEQRLMLRSIEEQRVALAVVNDLALDGRDDLRFARTHPAVWSHLRSEFESLELPSLPPGYHVFYRGGSRGEAPAAQCRPTGRRPL
jgi:hypothetical protein